jgi:hypothetical protein
VFREIGCVGEAIGAADGILAKKYEKYALI